MLLEEKFRDAPNYTLAMRDIPGFPGHGNLVPVDCNLLGNFAAII